MKKSTLRSILMPLLLAVAIVVGMFVGASYSGRLNRGGISDMAGLVPQRGGGNKITSLLNFIDRDYLDPVSLDSVTEVIMPMITGELDPHSVYIPAISYAQLNENLEGYFDGIGVHFLMLTDTVWVSNVIAGGPSEKGGLENGDRIMFINDTLVSGVKFGQQEVVSRLRGPRGSAVRLGIDRVGVDTIVPRTVIRGEIPIRSVTSYFEIQPGIGYIKLGQFSRTSDAETRHALSSFKGTGVNKVIFDLRGNGGGYLDQAISIANEFLPSDRLIVYTEDRYGRRKEQFSNGRGRFQDMEMVMLIDEQSASSSEILAGAIQDNDCGTIIGRRSFGKGLVQEQRQFSDGSAVRLTIARYYTPTGRSIQKPYTAGHEAYANDIVERYMHNELFSADSVRFVDSLEFITPGGKVVYGGGGIMPDIFVPLDTLDMTNFYLNVVSSGLLQYYVMHYSNIHRPQINAVRTIEEMNMMLDADTALYDDMVAYARRRGLKAVPEDVERSRARLTALLRANIGSNTVLQDIGFYANSYTQDETLLRAIEELRDNGDNYRREEE